MPDKNINDIKNIMKSAVPANDDVVPNKNNSKYRYILIVGIVSVLIILMIVIGMYVMRIDNARASRFSNAVATVAKCENKQINSVHSELRRTYGYDRYVAMTIMDYNLAMRELSKRKCN